MSIEKNSCLGDSRRLEGLQKSINCIVRNIASPKRFGLGINFEIMFFFSVHGKGVMGNCVCCQNSAAAAARLLISIEILATTSILFRCTSKQKHAHSQTKM